MNIIQVQDRLKGVTDDALVGYINNPTGEVPTYLALGEVGRREDMRKEYQASQAEQPQKTVAEEMVAKLSTPTGIGALTQGMAPEMPPEEVMSSSETISETGIAPLPTPNMPQNFERGGIVGYAPGGVVREEVLEGIGVNPNPFSPFDPEVAGTYGMPKEPNVADYKDYMNQKKEAFGIGSQYYDDERTAIQEEKDLIAKRRKGLMPDAMIRAGLGIMSGRDQNAFTNVAKGLTPAFEQYVKDDDMILKEEKLNRKEDQAINKAMRAEALGDMQGFEAYNKEIRGTQLKLIEINFDRQAKAITAGIAADSAEAKKRKDSMDTAATNMKAKYGDAGLITQFKTNKKGYDTEFFEFFETAYKTLGGNDPRVNQEFINSLIKMAPEPKGVSQSTEIQNTPKTEIVTGKDGKKYRKLPNGNYAPV